MSASSEFSDEWFDGDGPDGLKEPEHGGLAWIAGCALGEDEWIADRAVVALSSIPRITGHVLEILVQNRVVILLGDVDSAEEKTDAGRRAWSVPGVFDVANCLTVRGSMAGSGESPWW
jgi:hypothetical protein